MPAGTPAHRVVVQTRAKAYPYRREAKMERKLKANGKREKTWIDDPGGCGTEIVREVTVCPQCLRNEESH